MGLGLTQTLSTGGIPVFQKVFEVAQGGLTLDTTGLTAASTIPAGSAMGYNEATRKASLVKTAKVTAIAGGSATDYQVAKGHLFAVGEYIALVVGGKAYAITVIDTSNADYDVLTVGTTLTAAAVGDILFKSSATGATAAVYAVSARGLLYEDCIVSANQSLSVVLRGTVYQNRVPSVTTAIKALLPNIIFSQSY